MLQGLGVSSTPKLKIDPKVQAAQKQLVDVLSNVCQAQAQYHHRRQKETSYNSIMSWNEDNLKGYLDQGKNYLITLKQESRDCLNKHLGKVFAPLNTLLEKTSNKIDLVLGDTYKWKASQMTSGILVLFVLLIVVSIYVEHLFYVIGCKAGCAESSEE